ncbi:MAG: sugar phosphate isomerase/epimerase family protein [Christensenellaceae bacterium]|jgi:sugar phosphate isomerase/epimerase
MKLCFSTLGCPKLSFRDILSIAKDLQYNGVEMRGLLHVIEAPDIKEFQPDRLEDTKKRLADMNLEIPILTSACELSVAEKWDETFAMAKRYVDMADALRASYIRLLGDVAVGPTAPVDDQVVIAHTRQIADYALGKGAKVTLLLETNGAYGDSKRLKALLEAIDRENVGVVWDINHPYHFFQETVEETYGNIGKYVCHVHLKDSKKEADGTISYQMMGYGELPIAAMIGILKEHGYKGYYSLEWVKRWDMRLEEPGIAFAQYRNYMEQFA